MKILRKEKVFYVCYMVRFNTGIDINYIPYYYLSKQEVDTKITADPDKLRLSL